MAIATGMDGSIAISKLVVNFGKLSFGKDRFDAANLAITLGVWQYAVQSL